MSAARHVLFDAGGLALAVPADAVQAIHDELPLQRVEGTRGWFLGLAVTDGRLLPVTDLGAWLGLRAAGGRTLQLHPGVGIAGLRVDTVYGLSEADADATVPDADAAPREAAPRLVPEPDADAALTGRTIVEEGRQHRVVDLAALLQSPRFLDIAAGAA